MSGTWVVDLGTGRVTAPPRRGGQFVAYRARLDAAIQADLTQGSAEFATIANDVYPWLHQPFAPVAVRLRPTLVAGIASDDALVLVFEQGSRPHWPPYREGSRLWAWWQRRHGLDPGTVLGANARARVQRAAQHRAMVELVAFLPRGARLNLGRAMRRVGREAPMQGLSAYPVARAIAARGTAGRHQVGRLFGTWQLLMASRLRATITRVLAELTAGGP